MSSIQQSAVPTELSVTTTAEMGWKASDDANYNPLSELPDLLRQIHLPFCVIEKTNEMMAATGGSISMAKNAADYHPVVGFVSAQAIENLGDSQFCEDYSIRYPYMTGSMANGIASVELVEAIANADMLASFGAAGLSLAEIETAIQRLQSGLGDKPFACNLIFTPNEKGHEEAVVELFLKYGVTLVETSAYMKLTEPVVRYRVSGIHQDSNGNIVTPNRIIAKASRIELATKWFSPPPEKILNDLLAQGQITQQEAELAKSIPMAQDLTVEADSGGHTDNRPAITLLPTILALRDQIQAQYSYPFRLRVGAAGGIATPASALGAFSMGAAYIVTGTVNQACIESGSSGIVREMLANAEQADVTMAPAVDMFEMGVKLQVLKRGTMFAMRGNKLYDIYKQYDSIDAIPELEKARLEKTVFKMSMEEVWQHTEAFFNERDPSQVIKANTDPKHKMALVFRWYLGLSSRWANAGVEDRQVDYQVWCGPAMGAFNEWTRGTFLAETKNRDAVTVAMNILFGAAVLQRINLLQKQGVVLTDQACQFLPMPLSELNRYIY